MRMKEYMGLMLYFGWAPNPEAEICLLQPIVLRTSYPVGGCAGTVESGVSGDPQHG